MTRDREQDYAFVRAPRNIMCAQDLTSTEKVLLSILIDKYQIKNHYNKLEPDGSFHITGKELEGEMDIKKDQILKKHIPALESKGFIVKNSRPEDKEGAMKTYCYFTINWDTILDHKGDRKDKAIQAKRAIKAKKMNQAKECAPRQETSTMTEPQRPTQPTTTTTQTQPFDINALIIQEEEGEVVAADIIKHPEMYNAGIQWSDIING